MSARQGIALIGGFSRFTCTTLELLIAGQYPPRIVVLSAYGPSVPAESDGLVIRKRDAPSITSLCLRRKIPIAYYTHDSKQLARILKKLDIAVCVLACYPKFFPIHEFSSQLTFVNIHPSLLPKFRGIDPVFWQLRTGEKQTGFTIHHVDSRIDGGGVIASGFVLYPVGARLGEILQCVLRSAVAQLTVLLADHPDNWPKCDQNERLASSQRMPCAEDLWITTEMRAKTAFNFVRACRGEYQPLMLNRQGKSPTEIVDAVRYCEGSEVVQFDGIDSDTDFKEVPFSTGTVSFAIVP